jgi:hypothetical protein
MSTVIPPVVTLAILAIVIIAVALGVVLSRSSS